MAPNYSYLYIEDSKGKWFKGYTGEKQTMEGPKYGGLNTEMIKIYAINHSMDMPVTSHDKRANGAPMHSPLVMTAERDRSLPELYQAMNQGVHVQGAVHAMGIASQQKDTGETNPKHHNNFSIVFENALITSLSLHKPMSGDIGELVDISIDYRNMEWRDHDDKVYSSFSWDERDDD